MKLYISTDIESYGICTETQIQAVQNRMEIMADHLGIPYEYRDNQLGTPEDSHPLSEAIFEQAMDCATTCPAELEAARSAADLQCPLPA